MRKKKKIDFFIIKLKYIAKIGLKWEKKETMQQIKDDFVQITNEIGFYVRSAYEWWM